MRHTRSDISDTAAGSALAVCSHVSQSQWVRSSTCTSLEDRHRHRHRHTTITSSSSATTHLDASNERIDAARLPELCFELVPLTFPQVLLAHFVSEHTAAAQPSAHAAPGRLQTHTITLSRHHVATCHDVPTPAEEAQRSFQLQRWRGLISSSASCSQACLAAASHRAAILCLARASASTTSARSSTASRLQHPPPSKHTWR